MVGVGDVGEGEVVWGVVFCVSWVGWVVCFWVS